MACTSKREYALIFTTDVYVYGLSLLSNYCFVTDTATHLPCPYQHLGLSGMSLCLAAE